MTPVETYLGHLDAGDFAAAASVFTEDAVYVRPRFIAGADGAPPSFGDLVMVRGRDAIEQSFRKRGRQTYRHVILSRALSEDRCFVEMTLAGYGGGLQSIAVAELVGERIRRYVALAAPVGTEVALQLFPPGTSS
jgi:SnoaL-like domain